MNILDIVSLFDIPDVPVSFKECRVGHINSTYFINCESGTRYILQKINTGIFTDPDGLMNNIFYVTDFIRNRLVSEGKDASRGTLHFYPAKDGRKYAVADNSCYRIYECVENVTTLQLCDSADVFSKVGYAFGNFQHLLSDFDASLLCESIPDFHNTPKRYETLQNSIKLNRSGRAALAAEEIKFCEDFRKYTSFITEGISDGRFPLRVTHNDTKLNNILLDDKTLEPVCVIDLDTVMPGSVLYDFGDAIRSGAATAEEDCSDYDKCGVDPEMFRGFCRGFLEGLGGVLTDDEIRAFPLSALVITLETGIRFLTDYIDGDVYFHTDYPEHNLVRARNQFAMVRDIEKKLPELDSIVDKLLN